MNVDRILGSLREAKDARSIEIGVEAGVIPEELRGTGEFISPETLVRRGVLTPAELARLRRWTEHLERALLVSRRLPSTTPEEVLQRLRVPGALFGGTVGLLVAQSCRWPAWSHGISCLFTMSTRGKSSISWPNRSNVTTPGKNVRSS